MREQIMPLDDEKPRKFGGARPGAGRPLGSLKLTITKDLKQAILDGCVSCDYAFNSNDPSAPPSISTYMRNVANKHPQLFFSAIVRLEFPRAAHLASTGYNCGRYAANNERRAAGT